MLSGNEISNILGQELRLVLSGAAIQSRSKDFFATAAIRCYIGLLTTAFKSYKFKSLVVVVEPDFVGNSLMSLILIDFLWLKPWGKPPFRGGISCG